MNENKPVVVNKSGVGFCGLLTLIFIVLKLCKVIAWSWIWVLAPLWIPIGIAIALWIIIIVAGIITMLID